MATESGRGRREWGRSRSRIPKLRTYVVGAFRDEAPGIRLVGSVLMEIADEWQVARRYFSRESMRKLTDPEPLLVSQH